MNSDNHWNELCFRKRYASHSDVEVKSNADSEYAAEIENFPKFAKFTAKLQSFSHHSSKTILWLPRVI